MQILRVFLLKDMNRYISKITPVFTVTEINCDAHKRLKAPIYDKLRMRKNSKLFMI